MSAESLDQQIQKLISHRNFSEAEKLISEKLHQNPVSADAYYLRGVWNYFQGKLGETAENLKKALSLQPHHTDAAICLSVLYNDVGKYDDAKRVFDQANQSVVHSQVTQMDIGVDKKFAVKHLEIGDLYFRYRRYDEAIEEYGKAALLDPATLEIRIRLAKAFAKKGFLTRAMQELQQLKKEHSEFLPARLQLGLLHYSQGNLLDAELEWESVLTHFPDCQDAKTYLEMARKKRV